MNRSGYGESLGTPWRVWVPSIVVPELCESAVHVLLWQAAGTAELIVADAAQTLVAGEAFWIPVQTHHRFVVHAGSVTMPLFFDAADTATTLESPTLVSVDRDLELLFLAYSVSRNTIVQPATDLARQILAIIEEQPVVSSALRLPTSEAGLVVAEALRFNPGDIRSVEELAEMAHCSARTLERIFRSETGVTLRQWRIQSRMDTAAVLLRSDIAVHAVARRVGYTSTNAFRRVFHGHFGVSPSEFAARTPNA